MSGSINICLMCEYFGHAAWVRPALVFLKLFNWRRSGLVVNCLVPVEMDNI